MLGKAEFDQLLSERERLNEELQKIIDESTEPWGVKVTAVEIKDVEIPEQMQRAIARQAEAERERRAKIINSEGEFQAAQKLTDAADIISTNPASLQLRYLQTLLEIGCNQNTTVVFPLPMDVLEPFIGRADHKTGGSKAKTAAAPGTAGAAAGEPPTCPTISPPPAPERARDPHRPAERAEDDPRPGPRRAPGQLLAPAASRAEGRRRAAPSARAARTRTPPELYALRPDGGAADTPGWRTRVVPNLYPALGGGGWRRRRRRHRGSPTGAEAGSFASSGDPLLASRRAGEPDLFSSRPATGAHEVLINSPAHVTAMAELDDAQFAAAVATWRERMRAHPDASYLQLIVNEGGGAGASLEHTHAQLYALPFVPAAVARERERAGAYGERTAGAGLLSDVLVEEVRRQRPPGRDRRRGGADLPLGLALAVRAAGDPAPRVGPLRAGRAAARR